MQSELITITGYLATCDKYDRMRILIDSYDEMEKIISFCKNLVDGKFLQFPYTKFIPPSDGLYGECIIVIQKKYKTYWKSLIEEKRGKKISATVKCRKWTMPKNSGISFDLIEFN